VTFRSHTVPDHVHPLVKRLFEEMNAKEMTLGALEEKSGVSQHCFHNWRKRTSPRIGDLEACFNALGLRLEPVVL
jgi:hypothetical protein